MLITFEGVDGCGKSSIVPEIAKILRKNGFEVNITHEPGGTKICEKIRDVILKNKGMSNTTEALLYAASRKEHVEKKIIPLLKKKTIVLSDRYIDSSLAYQGIVKGIGVNQVLKINSIKNDILWPSITFLLDIDPKITLERIKKRKKGKTDRFDEEPIIFHNKVRQAFLKIAKKYNNRIIIIDANQSKQKIIEEISKKINHFIKYDSIK